MFMKKITNLLAGDKIIWLVLIILSFISLIEVSSSIGKFAYEIGDSPMRLSFKHFCMIIGSYILALCLSNINSKLFVRLSKLAYYFSVILLGCTFLFFLKDYFLGDLENPAAGRRLGIPGISFQSSEFAKYAVIIYIACLISKYKNEIRERKTVNKIMNYVFLVVILICPQNLSTAVILFAVSIIMLFLANAKFKDLGRLIGLAVVLLAMVITLSTFIEGLNSVVRSNTWMSRVQEWLEDDITVDSQENTAKKAIYIGGMFGNHPGGIVQGRRLDESYNDFIYAIIIEELGFVGGVAVLFLYSILFARCIVIARHCKSVFEMLVVSGIGIHIYLQALINMGVAVGYLPITGQTLPFISYGGSSYLATCCAVGVIQAIDYKTKLVAKAQKNDISIENEQ
jgi:cell division protein FtsW